MTTNNNNAGHDQWARLRFSVIGHLLIAPPARGELQAALKDLSQREWTHPHGHTVRFAFSTIESWYYDAQSSDDPIATLRRKRRSDAGRTRSMTFQLLEALIEQYHRHPWWSAQLHHDNLVALVHQQPELGTMPSYATVRRALRERGLSKRRRTPNGSETKDPREILSYEMSRSHSLWHGLCCGHDYVAERRHRRPGHGFPPDLRNIIFCNHSAPRKAIRPLFSFHGQSGPGSTARQNQQQSSG